MLWRGLTLLKTTHNHCHGSQGASQGNQQSDGHGGLMWCGLFQVGTDASFQPLVVPTGRQGAAGLE
jgi:hypothetical protein